MAKQPERFTYHIEKWTHVINSAGEWDMYAVIATPAKGEPFAFAFGTEDWCRREMARWAIS